MATGFLDTAKNKLAGICADVSTSTSPLTAREDAAETVGQLARTALVFSLAESTAAAAKASYRLPVMGNANYEVKSVYATLESGGLSAAGYTNYLSIVVSKYADGAATTKTTVASWSPKTDTCALGVVKAIPITGTAKLLSGGSLIVNLTKTGTGQTSGVANVVVELERLSD